MPPNTEQQTSDVQSGDEQSEFGGVPLHAVRLPDSILVEKEVTIRQLWNPELLHPESEWRKYVGSLAVDERSAVRKTLQVFIRHDVAGNVESFKELSANPTSLRKLRGVSVARADFLSKLFRRIHIV